MSSSRRKSVALKSVVSRRSSGSFSYDVRELPTVRPADLKQLVRVYLLDGSSKVLQMEEESIVEDVLLQLKYNMDLQSIATHALYCVENNTATIIPLNLKIRDILDNFALSAETGLHADEPPKILFRSWICDRGGRFERSVYQEDAKEKLPTTALWLKFMEEVYMTLNGKYILTREESILLGVLKMQSESGDYRPRVHTVHVVLERIATRFPDPIKSEISKLLYYSTREAISSEAEACAARVIMLYSRISGMTKPEARIEFLRTLRTWCPFYGASMFEVDCQYDYVPADAGHVPPVIRLTAAIAANGIYLISTTEANEQTIMLHLYSHILKYKAYGDQNILIYWALKKTAEPAAVYEAATRQGDSFDPDAYCDKIYLAADSCADIEFLISSYVALETDDARPLLPGASETYLRAEGLLPEPEEEEALSPAFGEEIPVPGREAVSVFDTPHAAHSTPAAMSVATSAAAIVTEAVHMAPEDAFLQGSLAQSLEKGVSRGSASDCGDDTAGVGTTVFKDLYASLAVSAAAVRRKSMAIDPGDPEGSVALGAPTVKLAVAMEDLQQKAASGIYEFSDDEEGSDANSDADGKGEDNGDSSSCGYSLSESSDGAPTPTPAVPPPGMAERLAGAPAPAEGRFSRLFKWG